MGEDQQCNKKPRGKAICIQITIGLVANVATLAAGMSLGFSAVALPQMKSPNSVPRIDDNEESWIASLAAIATPFGCLLSGPLLDRFGRRAALLTLNIPCLLGWILLGCAPHSSGFLPQVYAGRVFTGIATGMASVPSTVYLAEIAESSLRGMLVTWTSVSISLGVLIVYVLGWCLQENWRTVAFVCAGFPVLATILVIVMLPESPVWLLSNGRYEDAERSLRRVRGIPSQSSTPIHIQEELDVIASNVTQQNARRNHSSCLTNFRKSIFRAETIKPLIIMNAFFFFQQFSGIFVVIFYAVDVVEEAGVSIDGYLATVLIGISRVVMSIMVSYASNRFGRRTPSIISGAGMTLCMGILATYLCLVKPSINLIPSNSWLPVTALLLYILTSTAGFLTLPWAMIGEVFPSKARGLVSGITTCVAYVFSFIIVKLYPDMLHALGRDGVFFFYAAISLAGTVFVIFFLPETKGKTLQEVEEYFTSKKKRRQNGATIDNVKEQEEEQILQKSGKSILIVPANSGLISVNSVPT